MAGLELTTAKTRAAIPRLPDGNGYFSVTPVDPNGDPIPGDEPLRYGIVRKQAGFCVPGPCDFQPLLELAERSVQYATSSLRPAARGAVRGNRGDT